jgi:hypothetical protein
MTRQLGRPDWGKEALAGQRRWGKGRKEGGRERERVREREIYIGSLKFQTNPIVRPWFAGRAVYIWYCAEGDRPRARYGRLAEVVGEWAAFHQARPSLLPPEDLIVLWSLHIQRMGVWPKDLVGYIFTCLGGSSDCSCWLPCLDVLQWDHLRSASPGIPCGCCFFDPHELGNSNRDAFQSIHGVPLWYFYRFVAILVGLI